MVTARPTKEKHADASFAVRTSIGNLYLIHFQSAYGFQKYVKYCENGSKSKKNVCLFREAIVEDQTVNVLIINQAVGNTNGAIDKVRKLRGDDILIISCSPNEEPSEVVKRADFAINVNNFISGEKMLLQAKVLGAETFAHISFPRHMEYVDLAERRDIIKRVSESEGLSFLDLEYPDPMYGVPTSTMHILEDIPKQVERLGKNTAFFFTNCGQQISLIEAVVDNGGIYPQPCCPSPYHGFTSALGIEIDIPSGVFNVETGEEIWRLRPISEVIEAIRLIIANRGMTGRMSTAPLPYSMLFTYAAVEYGIKWMNGEVPREKGVIDYEAMEQIMRDVIEEYSGEKGLGTSISTWDYEGEKYPNYLLVWQDYLVF